MAQQVTTLGVFGLIQGRRFWNGTPRPLVDAGLVFAGGTAHLALIQQFSGDRISVRLALTESAMSFDPGPEFADALETSAVAITLEASGPGSITIPGPNHPDSIISDPTEPYLWQPSNGAAMTTWFESLTDTSSVVLTLDDGVAPTLYEVAAGTPSRIATGDVSWQDRDPPVGVADVSGLSSDSDPRYILRLRLWRDGRSAPLQLTITRDTPDGTNAFDRGDDLNTDWEGSAVALTLSAPNGDLVIVGPQHPSAAVGDDEEPYAWAGADNAALDAWVTAYVALGATDRALFSFTLDDDTGSTAHRVDAGGATWAFAVAEPMVTHVPRVPVAHAVDVGGAAWSFAVAQPTVTHTLASATRHHTVDAGGASWAFAVAEPAVTHVPRVPVAHAVAAGGATWSFAVAQPRVTYVRAGSDYIVEVRKIRPFAITGDRTDPEDLMPAMNRAFGFTVEYSQPGGPLVPRRLVNQLLHEFTVMLSEIRTGGLPPEWSGRLDYGHVAFVKYSGIVYKSLRDAGPTLGRVSPPDMDTATWRPY